MAAFVEAVISPSTPAAVLERQVAEARSLGDREIKATSELTSRLGGERGLVLADLVGGRSQLAHALASLRRSVETLDPARHDLGEARPLQRYAARYAGAEREIRAIVGTLMDGRAALQEAMAGMAQVRLALEAETGMLRAYADLAGRLDQALDTALEKIQGGDPDRASRLRRDVLFAVRSRRQEILTQLAVVAQGEAALRIAEGNHAAVIAAIDSATTTTLAALRTAALVAQAVATARSLDQDLAAARSATRGIEAVADADALRRSWFDALEALDRLESERSAAVHALKAASSDSGGGER